MVVSGLYCVILSPCDKAILLQEKNITTFLYWKFWNDDTYRNKPWRDVHVSL